MELSHWTFWIVLVLLTASNFFITYSSFTLPIKMWLFLLGIVIPLLFWLQKESFQKAPVLPFGRQEFLNPVTAGMISLGLGAVIVSRLWRIDSLFDWPLGDEGLNGTAAVELSRHWDWKFFYTSGQAPPLPVWSTACLLKLGCPALLSLWLPAGIVSILTVGAGYFATRQFFSRSFALIAGGLLAFSFWPLWIGRFCHQGIWLPLWTCVSLFLLGKFLGQKPEKGRIRQTVYLGLVTGLGSFTFTPWPSVALLVGIVVLDATLRGPRKDWKALGSFSGGVLTALGPFLWAVLHEGYGSHLREVSAWGQFHWASQMEILLGYGSVLGWGIYRHNGFYVPDSGGFLNPVLTALFCLGLVQVIRHRSSPFIRWVLTAGLLLFLPGLLSSGVEGFRVAQALPWVMLVTAWGFQSLLETVPLRRRFLAAAAIFLFSFCFDWGRLILPTLDVSVNPQRFLETKRSLARYRAYLAVKEMNSRKGPGLILAEWDLPADRTLDFASTNFNAADNPSLNPAQAQWLALVTDAHYRPFLTKRFPQAKWQSLDSDYAPEGNRDLALIPASVETKEVFSRWTAADKAFRDLNWGIDHVHDRDCLEKVNEFIREDFPLVQGDPYLESCFWEKTGQFYYYIQNHFPEHLRASELAVKKGYPAAHLYAKWAELLLLSGNKEAAQQTMVKAKESAALYPWR